MLRQQMNGVPIVVYKECHVNTDSPMEIPVLHETLLPAVYLRLRKSLIFFKNTLKIFC